MSTDQTTVSQGLRTMPWEHQWRGVELISTRPATLLAWEMGTGKTLAAIAAIHSRKPRTVLICCPKSVVPVWPIQFRRHLDDQSVQVLALDKGTIAERLDKARQFLKLCERTRGTAVVVCNYEAVWRDAMGMWLADNPATFEWIVLDESHKIKAPGGKASRFLARIGRFAAKRICLTGTPMAHSPLDVYAQYRFLDPSIFGTSFNSFSHRYAIYGGYRPVGHGEGVQIVGWKNQEELHEKFYRLADRIKSEDVLSLPEAQDIEVPVELSEDAMVTYRSLRDEMIAGVQGGVIVASNALAKLVRLQQITSGYAPIEDIEGISRVQTVDTCKRDALGELLEDLPSAEPVVVFCRFHADLDQVHAVAAELGRKSCELSGRRKDIQGEWSNYDTATVAAVQLQAGGLGIDLTRARYCVFYSMGFSLGDYVQARKRVHRPGQSRNVRYYHLICQHTIDQLVYKALEARQEVVESVLSTVLKTNLPAGLSDADLPW